MKKILLFIPFLLLSFSANAQDQDSCYSVNNYKDLLEQSNPAISFQLTEGWNMVGYTGTAENSGIVNQINAALSSDETAESTFQIIKNVSGQFWSPVFAQISEFTQGEGYMMYVISETPPVLSFPNTIHLPVVLGCMDCTSELFNPWATQSDGSCGINNQGCTDEGFVEYNAQVSVDDGSCLTPVSYGCTYPLALNYNANANTEDGSCEYFESQDQTGGGDCILPEPFSGHTGSNMTVMLTPGFVSSLPLTNENAYLVALAGEGLVVGSVGLYGLSQTTIAVWGDDTQTPVIDGALAGESISFQLVNGTDLYDVVMPAAVAFTANGLAVQASAGTLTPVDCGSSAVLACPYDAYLEYSSTAAEYSVSQCITLIVEGCTSELYFEYNPEANREDGSCLTLVVEGCTDNAYIEYNAEANTDDGTCSSLIVLGCNNPLADNYNAQANTNDGSCVIYGCMDEFADNYNEEANTNDDDCIYYGCINTTADNYNENANTDDGTCIIYGCTLAAFPNYNAVATTDDFSCDMNSTDVFGCTDADFDTYNPLATINNGSCENIEIGALMHGGIVFYIDATGEHGLVAALEDITEGSNMGPWGTPEGFEWGCYGTSVATANQNYAIGTGLENTEAIVSQNCQTENGGITAAQAALNYEAEGYTDWFLPSRYELQEMYNTIGNGGLEGNIGSFETSDYPYYWSSSEVSNDGARDVSFYSGSSYSYGKNHSLRLRVVRAF